MFFKDRIKNLKPSDRCLDVGPGAFPFAKATHFLEIIFPNSEEAKKHRSGYELPSTDEKWSFYDGKSRMPYRDQEFDYSICSHVFQMASDVDVLTREIQRVSKRGYIEFPHPLYDYLFNYSTHKYFVYWNGSEILWLDKSRIQFEQFRPLNEMMFSFFENGHCDFIVELQNQMFMGFEWSGVLRAREVKTFQELFTDVSLPVVPRQSAKRKIIRLARTEIRSMLRKVGI